VSCKELQRLLTPNTHGLGCRTRRPIGKRSIKTETGHELPLDIGVRIADNQPGSLRAQSRRLLQQSRRYTQLCVLDVNNHGKNTLEEHAHLGCALGLIRGSDSTCAKQLDFIGLREVYWRYVADPSGEAVFRPMGHCRGIGLKGVEDINPFLYPFFMPKSGSISSADRRFGAMATMYVQQGSNGLVRAAFSTVPRPQCEKNEFWSNS
jgi:hypothetical protein